MQAQIKIINDSKDFIFIEDFGKDSKSVTNDAKNVVQFLFEKESIGNKRIFYRDSAGRIDELLHDNGWFTGFAPSHRGYDESEIVKRIAH